MPGLIWPKSEDPRKTPMYIVYANFNRLLRSIFHGPLNVIVNDFYCISKVRLGLLGI